MADKDINIRISTEAQVEGVQEAAAAVEELAGQQTAAAEATREMDEAAEQSDGFKKLFDQQRLQSIGREIEKLGGTIGELVEGFKETKAGQEFFGGLSDEAKVFGGIAAEVGTSVVQGWAEGGPIGAALAGLNVLVKEVGDSFLAVARAEEQAAADLNAEMDRLTKQTRERKEVASDRAVEDAFRRESEFLGDQNEKLKEANELLAARRALEKDKAELDDEQDLAGGTSEEEIRIRKIRRGAAAEQQAIKDRAKGAREAALVAENEVGALERLAEGKKTRFGENSDEFRDAAEKLETARGGLSDKQRQAGVATSRRDLELQALEQRTARELSEEARRAKDEAARESAKSAADAARERDRETARAARTAAEERATANRRESLGRQGEGLANSAAGAVAGRSERAARQLEVLGDNLANNPTAAAADMLGKTVDRFAASLQGRDAATARKLRDLAQKFERIEADLKKLKTP